MEDDEGETSVTLEESSKVKTVEDLDSARTIHSNTSIASGEANNVKTVSEDNTKLVSVGNDIETAIVPSSKCNSNDFGIVASDSDVPKSPKKVNGEVDLTKCDGNEETSKLDYSCDNAAVDSSRSADDDDNDDNDTNSESEIVTNPRKRKRQISPSPDEVRDDSQISEGNVHYKGFKKRILAQTSIGTNNNIPSEESSRSVLKCKKSSMKKWVSESQHVLVPHTILPDGTQSSYHLTEYAQYLGLQPTVKFKCYKCGESGFPTMLKLQEHQNTCLKNFKKMQTVNKPTPPPPTTEPSPSTNFRITRKVYLCSACGTYYENWNLFLHMKEVHKRHICLFCLGMFSQADKLAVHLSGKHGVVEGLFSSSEQFVNEFRGSCFLMCCTCERIFTEQENYFEHSCSEGLVINTDKACSLCGLRGAHFPTCRRAFTDSSTSPTPSTSVPTSLESPSETTQNSQLAVDKRSLTVTKYLIPVGKVPPEKSDQKLNVMLDNGGEVMNVSRDPSDVEDDYDISNAASFCHVNIHEPQEKQKSVATSTLKTYKNKILESKDKDTVTDIKSAVSSPPTDDTMISVNNTETCNDQIIPDDVQDQDKTAELDNTTIQEKTSQETEECTESQDSKVPSESDAKEIEQEEVKEPNRNSDTKNTDLTNNSDECPQIEHEENEDTEPISLPQIPTKQSEESSTESPTQPDTSPKTSPQVEKVSSKTYSATEPDSESESSESGDESEDSSSSSEVSSEESDHHEEAEESKEKNDETDIDNADSDKMSLIVDENRSDEEDSEFKKEKTDDEEKHIEEDNVSEPEDTKQDDPKSDTELVPNTSEETCKQQPMEEEKNDEPVEVMQLAGDDVPLLELTLEENLDIMNIQMLLKESVKVSCLNCVYCNHAKKIAVNGKQLALHLLAEHRFAPVVCSDSGELTEADGFVDKLKTSLAELQQMFFNTDSYDNMDQTCMRPYDRTYECFHCHFLTTLHKELYVHNRKMHQKTILLCIMCKSNFYSYSELLCHLCPGIYVPESNISFRCCLCTVDGLPSAFRLMVHLRKRHHACDVCLETTGDQQKLSNHVWKHKLHHLCYRCGIAYRNKPDITKHLFWKHGTESVLCKKCLQKKWPHVYHFCIPPNAFVCEECNSSFSRAVALKVHKRLHAGDLPYLCSECEERFISKKLLNKHHEKHRDPPSSENTIETKLQENGPNGEPENQTETVVEKIKVEDEPNEAEEMANENVGNSDMTKEGELKTSESQSEEVVEKDKPEVAVDTPVAEHLSEISKHEEKEVSEKKSKVLDVYDLPPLNLSSESDDSEDEERKDAKAVDKTDKPLTDMDSTSVNEGTKSDDLKNPEGCQTDDDALQPVQVVDGIWDNFKTYKANLERRESQNIEIGESSSKKTESTSQLHSSDKQSAEVILAINMDHDYCGTPIGTSHSVEVEKPLEGSFLAETEDGQNIPPPEDEKEKPEEPQDKTEEETKTHDADHNYCYTNTTSLEVEEEKTKEAVADVAVPVPATTSPPKKKQKSPKKKQKRSASSSSSDSSSNSDSSTCSCGTNCSCSSSSSSSSGSSSSQSSDSDSSSSEGRRRQAARRERRRERAKKRKGEEAESVPAVKTELTDVTTNGPPPGLDEVPPQSSIIEPEEVELPIRESDLDTDETETDEDFYDKYPQRLANKLLAEKRNQLLLLAAVAPVNNGTMSQTGQSPPTTIEESTPKKKAKTKKHKKAQHQHISPEIKTESKLKLNIPTDYYSSQTPTFSKSTIPPTNPVNAAVEATPTRTVQSPFVTSHPELSTPTTTCQSTGSGSETESKRLSKRKRVPKRFYGDSSDEEPEQPPVKWRKVATVASSSPLPTSQPVSGFNFKSTSVSTPEVTRVPSIPVKEVRSEEEVVEDSDSDREETKKTSSESSNSESEAEKEHDDEDDDLSDAESEVETPIVQTNTVIANREGESVQQKNENLYCYCQCPYDEVSEMIACDGKDCTIEWFHFECVGIMVPPKGKWFCPDCRKRAATRSEYLLHV